MKSKYIFPALFIILFGAIFYNIMNNASDSQIKEYGEYDENSYQENNGFEYSEQEIQLGGEVEEIDLDDLPVYSVPEDNEFKNATGVSYWCVWYTKGDGKTYFAPFKQPYNYFSYKSFKKEFGKKAFLNNLIQIPKETYENDTTPTSEKSYWFIYVDSQKKSGYSYNTIAEFPHKHFSFSRAEQLFDEDVFINNFIRVNRETCYDE